MKTAVFTFGRFNPPTKGHERVVSVVMEYARRRMADAYLFPSPVQDSVRNPLGFDLKVLLLRQLFPGVRVMDDPSIRNPFHASGYLGAQNFTDIVFVVGSDRVDHFRERFNNTNKYFNSFLIVSAGDRDPDKNDEMGMSSSKAREAAKENDLNKFIEVTGWEIEMAQRLMDATQRGLADGG